MERHDYVNDNITLIQDTDGLTFGTDALLLAGYISGKYKLGCEFGGGSGIISLLLLARDKLENAVVLEVQDSYAKLIQKNAEINGLSHRLSSVCADVRDYRPEKEFEIIYTNPPYMKTDSGKSCAMSKKQIARHEVCGDISDFCRAARKMLKFGGSFAVVYRHDRLCDLMFAMRRSDIEPKRATFVYADTRSEPSMVLMEGKAGGKSGMLITRPLIIYSDTDHSEYSDDMKYIMENGCFPADFKR